MSPGRVDVTSVADMGITRQIRCPHEMEAESR